MLSFCLHPSVWWWHQPYIHSLLPLSYCSHLTVSCIFYYDLVLLPFYPQMINWLSSVLVIKPLSKSRLLFPRMHSNVDSFDSCVIFLVSSRQKNKLHTVSSLTLISVVSHAEARPETLRYDQVTEGYLLHSSTNLQSGFFYFLFFILNVRLVFIKRIQRISKAFMSKQSG